MDRPSRELLTSRLFDILQYFFFVYKVYEWKNKKTRIYTISEFCDKIKAKTHTNVKKLLRTIASILLIDTK